MRFSLKICTIAFAAAAFAATTSAQTFYREHCLFIKNGYLKAESAKPAELLADYHREADGKPIVIHFHGGLVSEQSAKKEASDLFNTCYGRVSYPIFFVWNADFFTELNTLLENKYHNTAFVQGHLSTAQFLEQLYTNARQNGVDLSQIQSSASNLLAEYRRFMKNDAQFQEAVSKQAKGDAADDVASSGSSWSDWAKLETWKRAKDKLERRVTNYFGPYVEAAVRYHDSRSVSWGGDLLEWISYNLGGRDIWSRMKRDTALSFQTRSGVPGAGLQFLWALRRERHLPRIVLVGHSTGCIYILNFLKAAKTILPGAKFDVVFLAPANTYKDVAAFLPDYADTINNFRMFGIRDNQERKDHMLWELNPQLAGLYPGSLLIYVSRAVESRHNAPILGLDRDFRVPLFEPDRNNNLVVRRLLFNRPGAIVWAPTSGPVGYCSNCVSHGDFCSDPQTLTSLRYLVGSASW